MSKPMRITPKRAAAAMLERNLSVAIDSMFEDPDSLVYYGVSEEDRALIAEQMHKIASPFLDRLHRLGALEVDLEESLMARVVRSTATMTQPCMLTGIRSKEVRDEGTGSL